MGLLANNAHVRFLQRELSLPFSTFLPKITYEQMEPCSSLRALGHDYFSTFMERKN